MSTTLQKAGHLDVAAIAGAARDIAFIAGIYLFFTGFAYRDYYLTQLAGPVSTKSQLDVANTVVYAYRVFTAHQIWLGVIFVVLCIAMMVVERFRTPDWPGWLRIPAAIAIIVLLFPLFDNWARQTADADAQALRIGLGDPPPFSDITFTAPSAKRYPQQLRDDAQGSVMVIGGDDRVTYVLDQKQPDNNCDTVDVGRVYAIPNADIAYYSEELPEITRGAAAAQPRPTRCPQAPK